MSSRSVPLFAGNTIMGENRVACRMSVRTAGGRDLVYYLRLNKPANQTVWEISIDPSWSLKLAADGASGRTVLPGLRIDRQFCWTLRGVP
jgi:hypothetical protein